MTSIGRLVVGLAVLLAAATAHAEHRAGVVILNSTGELITRCVVFEEEALSIEILLERAAFAWVGFPDSEIDPICYLHDDGVMDCTPHPDDYVWNIFIKYDDEWLSVDEPLSVAQIAHGGLAGFAYGRVGETLPPELSFAEVCDVISRAGLIFDFSDGTRVVETIDFYGETLTGLQLLSMTALDLVTQTYSFGIGICAIGGEGQPAEDCFGDPDFRYWGFNLLTQNDEWMSSPVGASEATVYDGDVHGWFYAQWGDEQPSARRADVFEIHSNVPFWHLYAH